VDGSTGAGSGEVDPRSTAKRESVYYYNSTVEVQTTVGEDQMELAKRRQSRYTDFFEALDRPGEVPSKGNGTIDNDLITIIGAD
jgi:hypothetical protein